MKKTKRILSAAMVLLLTATLPANAFAAEWYMEDGDITVNAGDSGQTVTQGASIDVPDSAPVITQHDSSTATTNTVTINAEAGAAAKVTLDGVNIDVSSTGDPDQGIDGEAAISTTGDGNVTIELDNTNNNTNTVISGVKRAGLEKGNDGELTITDADNDNGSLNATGGDYGAGIGGSEESNGENITITGGEITATGGFRSAGIGGGKGGNGSNITISGGTVTATGDGAGIGGGNSGSGSNITIKGGTVIATGGDAGIGGGQYGSGSNITIEGGTVTATGDGAGIGGGQGGNGSNITITGGEVTASSSTFGAGIGGGERGDGENITITGGKITATGGNYATGYGGAGIGGGGDHDSNENGGGGYNIAIIGGEVTAIGGLAAAGIGGGGADSGSSDIKVSGDAQLKVQGGKAGNSTGAGAAIGNGGISFKPYIDSDDSGRAAEDGAECTDISSLGENGYILYYAPDADMDTDQPTAVIHSGNTERHEGTLTVTPAVAATCATDGSTIGLKCTCGKIDIAPQTIEATGQHDIVIDPAVAPTYTSTGLTAGQHCTTCDTQTIEQEEIPMLQHETTPSAAANTTGESTENSAFAAPSETPLYRVIDAAGAELAYTASQENGVLTIMVNQETAVLTGYLGGISQLRAQGIETIVFGTNGRASAFRLEDLLANGNGGDNYRLTHSGAAAAFTIGAASTDISAILF